MADNVWTLLDAERRGYVESDVFNAARLGAGADSKLAVVKRTRRGGVSDGVDEIEIDNGLFAVTILPTRGMGLHRWQLRGVGDSGRGDSGGGDLGWKSPVRGPVHPSLVNLYDPSGLGWLDGFDEFFCRCGLESNGAPEFDERGLVKYPLHGKIANRPAHHVQLSYSRERNEVAVRGVVEESRFHFQKLRLTSTVRVTAGQPTIVVEDEVTNLSASPGSMQMLYHINFGGALLDAGSKVLLPVSELVPRNDHAAAGIDGWNHYPASQPGVPESVYLVKPLADAAGRTQALLRNAHGTLGASVAWLASELPCFSLWKNPTAAADGYVTGLEPGTNFPNPRSHEEEQKRVVSLAPGETRRFTLTLTAHATAAAVQSAEAAITKLQSKPAVIHRQPQAGWCAGVK